MKSQVSVEYLMIIGFTAVILIPLVILYFIYTEDSSEKIISSQMNLLITKIISSAETVNSLGNPSRTTIKATIPNKISGASIANNEINFNISTGNRISSIYRPSSVNIIGDLPSKPGTYEITIKARENDVEVSYK